MTATQGAAPRISVLIPAYNHEAFITECLDSVLASGGELLEILVHDDGSRDATHARAVAWAQARKGAPTVRVSTGPNQGPTRVLNDLLEAAGGEYVVALASDDRLTPGGLSALAAVLDDGAGAAFGEARVIDAAGIEQRTTFTPDKVRAGMRRDLVRELIMNWAIAGPVLMVRRSVLERVGGWDITLRVEDWDLYLRLAATDTLRHVDTVVADYRVHSSNASLDPTTERARMREASLVAWRRARDFTGRNRALLIAKAMYLRCLEFAGPMRGPLRAVRRQL